jgi:hypothetical protein
MSLTSRIALGSLGGLMLLHVGCSAFEALTYEKAVDPIAPLEIPGWKIQVGEHLRYVIASYNLGIFHHSMSF